MTKLLPQPSLSLLVAAALFCSGCVGSQKFADLPPADEDGSPSAFDLGGDLPPTPKTLYALARVLLSQGRVIEAQQVLTRIVAEHPEYPAPYNELSELYVRDGRADEAVEVLTVALKSCPGDPILLNNLGMCWMVKKDYVQALRYFREADEAAPSNRRFRSNMAVAMAMVGRYAEALETFEEVLSPSDAHYNLAVICEARGDYERAREEFEKARQLEPPGPAPSLPTPSKA